MTIVQAFLTHLCTELEGREDYENVFMRAVTHSPCEQNGWEHGWEHVWFNRNTSRTVTFEMFTSYMRFTKGTKWVRVEYADPNSLETVIRALKNRK